MNRIHLSPLLLLLLSTSTIISISLASKDDDDSMTPNLDEPFQTSFESLAHVPCVTLYHRNGRIGCGTLDRDVQTGVLTYYDSSSSSSSSSLPSQPHVIVLDEKDLTKDTVDTILTNNNNNNGQLQGILVLNGTSAITSNNNDDEDNNNVLSSPASQTPQGYDTPSSGININENNYVWNPNGDNLLSYDLYGIPMAYITSEEVSSYIKEVSSESSGDANEESKGKNNAVVAEFNYYMGGDNINSNDCLSWKDVADDEWRPKCLPLGGTSVWAMAGSPTNDNNNNDNNNNERKLEDNNNNNNNNGQRDVIMISTSIDSTSMFHDASPGANTAASNILSLLMAVKLVGTYVSDDVLDNTLSKQLLFTFFQGESYGMIGSRTFLRDVAYPGFTCSSDAVPAASANNSDNDEDDDGEKATKMACLYPLRPSLDFQGIGNIVGMLSVDQIGVLSTDKTLYVHNDGNDDFGAFVSQILQASSTDEFSVVAAGENDNNNDNGGGDYSYPPTPLSSLISLSEGNVGGAILTGYDDTYANDAFYHSHLDSKNTRNVNLDAIAAGATLIARTAIASAYDNGDMDADTASQYASNLIPELSSEDETLIELADCLFVNGNCDLLKSYGNVEQRNIEDTTGIAVGLGVPLGTPPNYYVSVYDINNGQPFVQVGDYRYGAYDGDDYGKEKTDAFAMRPSLLEMSIHGMLNDFLGRGSVSSSSSDNNDSENELVSCKSSKDCSDVAYCSDSGNDEAVCAGSNVCVCSRARYHLALDEALEAPPNNATGRFVVSSDDEGISAMYTEPYWSNDVGVRVYRHASDKPGRIALISGVAVAIFSILVTLFMKRQMKKEKLY